MDKSGTLRSILENSKAVIFDFDNVVVDSEPYHLRAYSAVFASKGHTIDTDEYWLEWTSLGGGAEGEIQRYGLDLDPDDIRREKDPIYSAYCSGGEIPVFPEALKIINSFALSGFIMAIASGSYEDDINAILSLNGISRLFASVTGKDGISKTKPDPETYIRALDRLGLSPRECFAIEDAEKGVISAHGAGMKVITVETAVTKGFDLSGADLNLSGLEELYSLMIDAGLKR
ncbi:MAG: HAD family phosphatase [Candidatus Krumholzibacteriota bacterium]|nr:HAD family phosphatase [Candidatus Krumholzibacteriota bacterium]